MNRLLLIFFSLTLLPSASGLFAQAPSASSGFSERVEAMLRTTKATKYQHQTEIDETEGGVFCDCSGLMCYVLRHDYPEAYVMLRGELAPWRSRPLAATFFETFERAGRAGDGVWQQVPKLMDARPGDILAWRKRTLKKGSTTGHVCMIGSVPVREKDGRVRVRIVDSTGTPRANDTRPAGSSGFGAGEMWFETDAQGLAVAFWSTKGNQVSHPIAIGRLTKPHGKPAPDLAMYVGLSESEAAALAAKNTVPWRVIERDGKTTSVSMRPNPKRLNAVIEKGRVVRVRRG